MANIITVMSPANQAVVWYAARLGEVRGKMSERSVDGQIAALAGSWSGSLPPEQSGDGSAH
jgi:hypothetical protein